MPLLSDNHYKNFYKYKFCHLIMKPKTFTEKWDKEEKELEKVGLIKRKFVSIWKNYMKFVIGAIIIFIISVVIIRVFR